MWSLSYISPLTSGSCVQAIQSLEMWYRLIRTLSCDKRPLPNKIASLRTVLFCLSKFQAFCYETFYGCCVTERRILQILIPVFSRPGSFMMLLHTRIWNSNPHLTLSYSANVFWRVLFSILLSDYVGQVVRYSLGLAAIFLCTQTRKTILLASPQDTCFSQLFCRTKLRLYPESVVGQASERNSKFLYHFHEFNSKDWRHVTPAQSLHG